jgi:hypothetical protein
MQVGWSAALPPSAAPPPLAGWLAGWAGEKLGLLPGAAARLPRVQPAAAARRRPARLACAVVQLAPSAHSPPGPAPPHHLGASRPTAATSPPPTPLQMADPGADIDALSGKMDRLQSQIDAINGWEIDRWVRACARVQGPGLAWAGLAWPGSAGRQAGRHCGPRPGRPAPTSDYPDPPTHPNPHNTPHTPHHHHHHTPHPPHLQPTHPPPTPPGRSTRQWTRCGARPATRWSPTCRAARSAAWRCAGAGGAAAAAAAAPGSCPRAGCAARSGCKPRLPGQPQQPLSRTYHPHSPPTHPPTTHHFPNPAPTTHPGCCSPRPTSCCWTSPPTTWTPSLWRGWSASWPTSAAPWWR